MSFLKTLVQKLTPASQGAKLSPSPSTQPVSPINPNTGNSMLEGLITAFKSEFGLSQSVGILSNLHSIEQNLQANYVKDGNARNAAIDSVCEYLQSLKTVAVSTSTTAATVAPIVTSAASSAVAASSTNPTA